VQRKSAYMPKPPNDNYDGRAALDIKPIDPWTPTREIIQRAMLAHGFVFSEASSLSLDARHTATGNAPSVGVDTSGIAR
jgi:hypothetical protein